MDSGLGISATKQNNYQTKHLNFVKSDVQVVKCNVRDISPDLICLLQYWWLLVDVYGRMASVDDVWSLLWSRGAVRRLGLRLVDWSLGRSWTVVGLLGRRWLVAGLNGAVKCGNSF